MTLIEKYFPALTPEQKQQFALLEGLYAEWNAKINVISRKDFVNFYTHHVLHSLGIAKVCDFSAGSRVLDVGTGGGFPTIPLAILYPGVHFTAVDSIAKKIRVVEGVVEGLGLTNVTPVCARAEELKGTFDYVVSRAVTQMPVLVGWVWSKLKPGGTLLALKGGDLTDELAATGEKWQRFPLNDYFNEEFFDTKKVVFTKK